MSHIIDPLGGGEHIVVSLVLEGEHAHALDQLCGQTLSSRAGLVRRILVSALRSEGYLPPLTSTSRQSAGEGQAR